jgi:hypothetical protein
MGLDWNPLGRPRPGHEEEFAGLFRTLFANPVNVGLLEKLLRRLRGFDREKLSARWFEIQISPYEALDAPRVGSDPPADEWARQYYRNMPGEKKAEKTEAEFLKEMSGYYVLQLVPACDGIPMYSNGGMGYVERFSFRGQFLVNDCKDIIGSGLVEQAFQTCLAPGLASLGAALMEKAVEYAARNNVSHVADVRQPDFEEGSPEGNAHIVFSAAKWCNFWSSRGHGLEAYF